MREFFVITKRNVKMFFKDKGMFFTSLITPVILLVLYATFLAKVYKDSFIGALKGTEVSERLINGMVGGELTSSLLAVCCVTVAFCSNLLMVQDKVNGVDKDFAITPVKRSVLATSYFFGSLFVTLIIAYVAMAACYLYLAISGWMMPFIDIVLVFIDVFLLTAFGTALASVVNVFLKTQGQASGVGTIVSAGYGFVCGAYMPLSQFGSGLRNVLSCLPGTYGTSIIRTHALNGVFGEMSNSGFPAEMIESIKEGVDCSVNFFGNKVGLTTSYIVLIAATLLFVGAYVAITVLKGKKKSRTR